MPAAFLSHAETWSEPLKRRGVSMALVIAIHLLLLLLLLKLAPPITARPPAGRLIALNLLPERKASTDRSKAAEQKQRQPRASRPKSPIVVPKPIVRLPPTKSSAAAADAIWAKVTPLTSQEMADADRVMREVHDKAPAADDGDAGGGDQSASARTVGTGPNGQPLYEADWYRRPTDAELSPYIPASAPHVGWGMIACQTVEGYRVDNCTEIGQSPPGSGLAGAVRQAAWQFRVIPPRKGGHAMIGAWVRIRIDYTQREAK